MIDIPFDIDFINRRLLSKFGRTLDNKVKFRVIWSDSQIEHRKREVKNGIVLPNPEVELLPKYSYLHRQWVLERWVPHDNSEIITMEGGTYEPIWAFAKDLRPVWRAVEIIALMAENGISERASAKDLEAKDEKALIEEIGEFEEQLKEAGTDYGNQTDAFVKPMYMEASKQKYKE